MWSVLPVRITIYLFQSQLIVTICLVFNIPPGDQHKWIECRPETLMTHLHNCECQASEIRHWPITALRLDQRMLPFHLSHHWYLLSHLTSMLYHVLGAPFHCLTLHPLSLLSQCDPISFNINLLCWYPPNITTTIPVTSILGLLALFLDYLHSCIPVLRTWINRTPLLLAFLRALCSRTCLALVALLILDGIIEIPTMLQNCAMYQVSSCFQLNQAFQVWEMLRKPGRMIARRISKRSLPISLLLPDFLWTGLPIQNSLTSARHSFLVLIFHLKKLLRSELFQAPSKRSTWRFEHWHTEDWEWCNAMGGLMRTITTSLHSW